MNFRRMPIPACFRLVLASALLAILGGGCEESTGITEKIFIRSEPFFYGKPGEEVGPLIVQVLGPAIHGVPGRSGFRDPVVGKTVGFEIRNANPDLAPSLGPAVMEGKSDAGEESAPPRPRTTFDVDTDSRGFARIMVRLPVAIGDWRIQAGIRDEQTEERKVYFGVVSGIKVQASEEENLVGRKVQASVVVYKVVDGQVLPDDGRPVTFRIAEEPALDMSRLAKDRLADRVRANDQGVAVADVTLGERSGPYIILAQPQALSEMDKPPRSQRAADRAAKTSADPDRSARSMEPDRSPLLTLPAVVLRGIAIDWTKAVAGVVGGVLLFIIGLRFLASGLIIILSPSLASPGTRIQKSRLRGFLGGLAAGAMFQSSRAISTRLISFANGGLLAASGAMSLILGANIGRTLLPQLLAFPISYFAAVFLCLGVLGLFLPRRWGLNAWGWVILGAGITILGFVSMEWGADLLQFSKTFKAMVQEWDYSSESLSLGSKLWLFSEIALASASVGFLFRSSNLPVVLSMALGSAGLLDIPVALPVVLGANLGPSVALLIASVGRRREARRIALVQFLFQAVAALVATVVSLITIRGTPLLLHLADWFTPGHLFHPIPEHVSHHIAMVHTLYNTIGAAVCFLLSRSILRLAERLIPRDPVEDDIKPYNLDPNLAEVPALAILQSTRESTYLAELCRKAVAESFDAFRYRDLKLADQTIRREESIAGVHRELSQYLLAVGENDLSRREASRLEILQAATGALSRIGAQSERLRDLTLRESEENWEMPEDVGRDLNEMYDLVMAQFDNVLQLLEGPDGRTEENAVKLAERLAKFGSRVEHAWLEKLRGRGAPGDLDGHPIEPEKRDSHRDEPKALAAPQVDAGGVILLPAPVTASAEAPAGNGSGGWGPKGFARLMVYRDALEALFQVAGHLSHITERMRVLTPKR
jgi:phosphate:Na+ symporter